MHTQQDRRHIYRVAFNVPVDMEMVEETLALSILAVSCLEGDAAVRLGTGYALNAAKRVVVLEAATDVAQTVARLFLGLITRKLGATAFNVTSVPEKASRRAPKAPSLAKAA